jgi:Xaa-Pro aminopeptidase
MALSSHGPIVTRGEYVAACDERLSWLTGFTGSAGFACILETTAGIFIDGRYRLQVCEQVAEEFTPVHWPETPLHEWLTNMAAPGAVIGFDPWLHTVEQIEILRAGLDGSGMSLVACSNGVDAIWTDRPPRPTPLPGRIHPIFAARPLKLNSAVWAPPLQRKLRRQL